MMKQLTVVAVMFLVLAACGEKEDKVSVHKRIEAYEDSVKQWGGGQGTPEARNAFADRYIKALLEAVEVDSKDPQAATYLDRVHMWYTVKHDSKNAVKYAEQVLDNYPKYENRQMLLESVAYLYDSDVTPRDTAKVRKYYTLLLKEYPSIETSVKEDIQARLKHNNLTFEEYVLFQIKQNEENVPLD